MDAPSLPFPKHGIRLSHLQALLESKDFFGGREKMRGLTTTEVCEQIVKPLTLTSKTSLCEYLQQINHAAFAKESTVFISHAWKYLFLDVMDAVIEHFQQQQISFDDVVIWFDLFSNNQHQAVSLDFTWWSTTFFSAIEQFHYTVMVLTPWQNPIPFTRVWCLFELFCTVQTKSRFEIALTKKEKAIFLQQMIQYPTKYTEEMLATIDCRNSDCFIPQDKVRIFAAIEESVGFNMLNRLVIQRLQTWNLEFLQTAYEEVQQQPQTRETEVRQLSYLHAIADLKHFYGFYEEATNIYEECLQRRQAVLGDDHLDTLITMSNLAQHYDQNPTNVMDTERRKKAVDMLSFCFQTFSRLYGEINIYTITAQLHLAIAKMHENKSEEEQDKIEKILLKCLDNAQRYSKTKDMKENDIDKIDIDMLILQCSVTLAALFADRYESTKSSSNANKQESDGFFTRACLQYQECIDKFSPAVEDNKSAKTDMAMKMHKSFPLYLTALYGYAALLMHHYSPPPMKAVDTSGSIVLPNLLNEVPVLDESSIAEKEEKLRLARFYAETCHNKRLRMFGADHFLTTIVKELMDECDNQLSLLTYIYRKPLKRTISLDSNDPPMIKDIDEDDDADFLRMMNKTKRNVGGDNMRRQLYHQTSDLQPRNFRSDDIDEDNEYDENDQKKSSAVESGGCCVCM
jgi:uncharacterized protein (DUF2267 family)